MAMNRIPALDTLRAAAISLVLICHVKSLPGTPDWWMYIGLRSTLGVDIFFVLSGWLITSALMEQIITKKKVSMKAFFIKRFFRIIPTYLLSITAAGIIYKWKPYDWLAHFLFIQPYTSPYKWLLTWSISVEIFFYLIVPFLVLGLAKPQKPNRTVGIFFLLTLFSLLLRWQAYPELTDQNALWHMYNFYNQPHLHCDGVFIGAFFAVAWHFKKTGSKNSNVTALLS